MTKTLNPLEGPTEVVVRPVRSEDAAAVYGIQIQPSSVAFTNALPSERFDETRRNIESFGPDDHVLVAEVDGEVVGMASIHLQRGKQRHIAELGILVREDVQGRGVGRCLIDGLLAIADDHLGLIRVELEVLADNARAISLYERCGFMHEGRRRLAYRRNGRYVDALHMGRIRDPAYSAAPADDLVHAAR